MKILQINPYPPESLGGSEIFCKNLAINLSREKKITCDILTSDILKKKAKTTLLDNSIQVIYKKCYYNLWNKNPLVNVYSFLKKNYFKYDLIHAHSYIFFTSIQCALLRKLRNFPFVLHIHGGIQTPLIESSNLFEKIQLNFKRNVFDKIMGKFTIESADAIISVSNKDLVLMNKIYNINRNRSFYIPNGVDISRFQKDENKKREFITFIGRLSYIKGIDIFIKVIKELYNNDKRLKFLIIGDGPLRNIVEKAKNDLPITHYKYYPYEKIQNIYNISKVILLTSRFEGLPTILLESLASETPVIASNVGGVSEIIKTDKNGLLFNQNDIENYIQDIIELISDDTNLAVLGKNGRDLIRKDFTWNIITEKIMRVYQKIIDH